MRSVLANASSDACHLFSHRPSSCHQVPIVASGLLLFVFVCLLCFALWPTGSSQRHCVAWVRSYLLEYEKLISGYSTGDKDFLQPLVPVSSLARLGRARPYYPLLCLWLNVYGLSLVRALSGNHSFPRRQHFMGLLSTVLLLHYFRKGILWVSHLRLSIQQSLVLRMLTSHSIWISCLTAWSRLKASLV